MNYNLENIREMTGALITIDETAVVQDVYIELDSSSARKLAAVLRNNRVTRENQDLFFKSITINKNSLKTFTKGQSGLVKDGDRYVMTANSYSPTRFKGFMQTLVTGSDGKDYACQIEIGNIDFNISNERETVDEDTASFENVTGTLYPYGSYRAFVVQE